MFEKFFKKRRLKRYVRVLTPELKRHYGIKTHYTREQVNDIIAKRRLQKDTRNDTQYVYAMYCSPTDFQSGQPFTTATDYVALRDEIGQLCFGSGDFTFNTLSDYADSCSNDSGDSSSADSGGDSGGRGD